MRVSTRGRSGKSRRGSALALLVALGSVVAFVVSGVGGVVHAAPGPSVPAKPVSHDPDVAVAPEWMRAYERKLEVNAVWGSVPHADRSRAEADYAANAARFDELTAAAYALAPRVRTQAAEVAAWKERDSRLAAEIAAFNARCTTPGSDDEARECQAARADLVARVEAHGVEQARLAAAAQTLGADVGAHNTRARAWATGPVEALVAYLDAVLAAARAPLDAARREALEAERTALRADVEGIAESLRRLERQHETAEGDRADWERRHEEAREQAAKRATDLLTDTAVDAGIGLLAAHAKTVGADIRRTLDERITVAGGDAPDRAERLKALDAKLASLFADRTSLEHASGRVDEAKLRLTQALAGLQAATAEERQEKLEAGYELLSALLADPLVEKALRISGAYAKFATFAKLAVDSSLDVAAEIAAIVRIRSLGAQADRYLEDVKRIDGQMKAKVARIQEINRLLEPRR